MSCTMDDVGIFSMQILDIWTPFRFIPDCETTAPFNSAKLQYFFSGTFRQALEGQ